MRSYRYAAWAVAGWYAATIAERDPRPSPWVHAVLASLLGIAWLVLEVRREMADRRERIGHLPRRDNRWV